MLFRSKKTPHLAAILIGNNGASETYVASKVKSCEEIGFKSTLIRLDAGIAEAVLIETIERLNNDDDVDGILVQTGILTGIETISSCLRKQGTRQPQQ